MQENNKNIINNPGSSVLDEEGNVIVFDKSNPPTLPFLGRRFVEILLSSVVCSLPLALLFQIKYFTYLDWAFKIIIFSMIAFILLNVYLLRAFYYSMGSKKVYFSVNFVAYAIYAIVSGVILYVFKDEEITSLFSHLFMPQKGLFITMLKTGLPMPGILPYISAVATHILMIITIFAAPCEMYSFDKKKGQR